MKISKLAWVLLLLAAMQSGKGWTTEIRSWEAIGTRWAISRDADGHRLGIHDLSYPTLLQQLHLGTIGNTSVKGFGLDTLRAEADKIRPANDDEAAKLRDLKDGLDQINHRSPGESFLPDQWWKDTPWKEAKRQDAPSEPDTFRLSEIDLEKAVKNSKREELARQMSKIHAATQELAAQEGLTSAELLDYFLLVREKPGIYTVEWSPRQVASAPAAPMIANISEPKMMLRRAILLATIREALGFVNDFISVPVVSALVGTSIDRFFHFESLLRRTHLDMGAEMLRLANEGKGPFTALSAAEQQAAADSILYGETGLLNLVKWTWTTPSQEWVKLAGKEAQAAKRNTSCLERGRQIVLPITGRFAQVTRRDGSRHVDTLGYKQPFWKSCAAVAVEQTREDKTRSKRIATEAGSLVVNFGSYFIPFGAGALLRTAYDYFVEDPMALERRWEGRLTSYFEETASTPGYYEQELNLLYDKRVNPFEISREEIAQLIAQRRKALFPAPALQ